MSSYSQCILRIFTKLLCVFLLWLGQMGYISAEIIPANTIREAIIDTLTAVAERKGLEIQVSVPHVAHVAVKGSESWGMNVRLEPVKTFRSRMPVKVEFLDTVGKTVRLMTVTARLKSYATVAVTVVVVNRGDVITLENVVMKKVDVAGREGYFVSYPELAGMQAKRRLRAGTILTGKNVEPIPVIRRGDRVVMKAFVGNAVITAEGTAREDGSLNECIRIYNKDTRKTIICRVIDSKTVMIDGEGG